MTRSGLFFGLILEFLGDDFLKEQLTVSEIVNMLLRRWWIIAFTAFSLAVAAFFYSQFMLVPLYRTDGSLFVNASRTQTSDVSSSNILASQQLATTCKEILTRRTFLAAVSDDVVENGGHRYPPAQLKKMISIRSVNDTEIMEITVSGSEREDLKLICDSVLTMSANELSRVINAGQVKILDLGQVPEKPYSPNTRANTLLCFFIGLLAGSLIVFCIELLDTRVKSRDDIVTRYEGSLLGEIPELSLVIGKKEDGYSHGSYAYHDKGGKK